MKMLKRNLRNYRYYSKNYRIQISPDDSLKKPSKIISEENLSKITFNVSKLEKQNKLYTSQQNLTSNELLQENIRQWVSQVVSKEDDVDSILVEGSDSCAAGEGASTGLYRFPKDLTKDYLEGKIERVYHVFQKSVEKIGRVLQSNQSDSFQRGVYRGQAQNMANFLAEMPANLMTPSKFCEFFQDASAEFDSIECIVRDEEFARKQKFESFLSVAKGSSEPPKILELHYRGNPSSKIDFVQVGKGITFDSGGISIKPSSKMHEMKGDMGGAAAACSSLFGIANAKLPINVTVIAFLCENMVNGNSLKPGDIIRSASGKTIEVLDTDAEGRLILADALHYASTTFPSEYLIDLATLTGAIMIALGEQNGVFCTDEKLWELIQSASKDSSDLFWRMPLSEKYLEKMKESVVADLSNLGSREGGACSAAAFLSEFVSFGENTKYAHIDIAGTAIVPSKNATMTGKPTRGLISLAEQISLSNQDRL